MSAALSIAVWLCPYPLAVFLQAFALFPLFPFLLCWACLCTRYFFLIAIQNIFTLFSFSFCTILCSIITCNAHLMKIKHDILVTGSVAILSLISGNCTQLSHILLYDNSDNAAPAWSHAYITFPPLLSATPPFSIRTSLPPSTSL